MTDLNVDLKGFEYLRKEGQRQLKLPLDPITVNEAYLVLTSSSLTHPGTDDIFGIYLTLQEAENDIRKGLAHFLGDIFKDDADEPGYAEKELRGYGYSGDLADRAAITSHMVSRYPIFGLKINRVR